MLLNGKGFLLLCIFVVPVVVQSQLNNSYSLEGYIEGLHDGEKVTMNMFNSNGIDEDLFDELITTDSAFAKNGKFFISGHVPDGPRLYWMKFDKHRNKTIRLLIDSDEKIKIVSGDMNNIPHTFIEHYVKIEGSLTNYGLLSLDPTIDLYHQSVGQIYSSMRQVQDSIGFNGSLIEGLVKAKNGVDKAFYLNVLTGNTDPEIEKAKVFLPFRLYLRSCHASFWNALYETFSTNQKKSFYGKCLKKMATLCVGQPFPEFVLPNMTGKSFRSTDITQKNKLTIIQFWAENSFKREEYQKELMHFYAKYHNKGLEVIGVSSDIYAEQWKHALDKNKLPWLQVIDLKGLNGIVKNVYHEYSTDFSNNLMTHNTTNVIVDQEGKIVAWDTSGIELQYYLWKYFEN